MSDFKLYSNDMLNRVDIVKNRPGVTIWSKNQTNKKSKPNKQEKKNKEQKPTTVLLAMRSFLDDKNFEYILG